MSNRKIQNRFRFKYDHSSGNVDQVVVLGYDEGFEFSTEMQANEFFYRLKSSYSFTVVRPYFQLFKDAPFEGDYFVIFETNTLGAGWVEKWRGKVNYTDFDIDDDERKIEFSAETIDSYTDILNNYEREIDLFDLGVSYHDIQFLQKGLLQFYILGTDTVTNYTENGSWYEQKVSNPTQDHTVLNDVYHFSPLFPGGLKHWCSGSGAITPDVSGYYTFNGGTSKYENGSYEQDFVDSSRVFTVQESSIDDFDDFDSIWSVGGVNFVFKGVSKFNGKIKLYFFRQGGSNSSPSSGTLTHVSGATNTTDIIYQETEETNENDGIRRSIRLLGGGAHQYIGPTFKDGPFEFSIAHGERMKSIVSSSECSYHIGGVFVRGLTTKSEIENITLLPIPENDFVQTNYLNAFDPTGTNFQDFYFSDENSITDQLFGKFPFDAPNFGGNYYSRPSTPTDLLPIGQSGWNHASIWFKTDTALNTVSAIGGQYKTIQAFKLDEVIKALLNDFSTITFEPDTDHSTFLFSETNPISADSKMNLYITPKSNVTKNGYDFAAKKAPIKLKDLMDSLKGLFHSGWNVDSNDRFKIEHALWYWYGGQNGAPLVSYNMTALINPKNGKPWSFGTNKYSFKREEIPSQTKFLFMDESSEIFEGFPIEHFDNYVKKDRIDEVPMPIISTDIDAMISNPGNFSKNGFALLDIGNANEVKYTFITYKGISMNVQNGRLSLTYLIDKFYRSPSICEKISINGVDFTATILNRFKEQKEFSFPLENGSIDPINLFATSLGNGKIVSMVENPTTHELKIKLRHDTEK